MTPSIGHFLDASLRALAEVVSPAVDPDNHFALEQLALVQGTLSIIKQQWSRAYELECIELKELSDLASSLLRIAGPAASSETQDRINEIANKIHERRIDQPIPYPDLRAMNEQLRNAIDKFVDKGGKALSGEAYRKIARLVTNQSFREAERAKSWFAATRLDLHWNDLPSIDDTLSSAAKP